MTKKQRKAILAKIDWEGGYEEYFMNYGTNSKDREDIVYNRLVQNFEKAFCELKGYLENS